MRWFFLIVIFIFLTPPLVFSQPFQQSQADVGELDIVYPKEPSFQQGTTIELDFHLFNSSGGHVPPSQGVCQFHLYRANNSHYIQQALDETGLDFYIIINQTITNTLGIHPYVVWCNSTYQFGYLSGYFEVTPDGTAKSNLTPLALMLLTLFGVYFFLAKTWDIEIFKNGKQSQTSIVKILMITGGIWMLPVLVRMMQNYTDGDLYALLNTLYFGVMVINITISVVVGIFTFYNIGMYVSKLAGGGGR